MHPLGGLARRAGYINAFKSKFPGVPSLFLDTGHAFTDHTRLLGKLTADSLAKNEWILDAYSQMRYDVINLSPRDLPYVAKHVLPPDVFGPALQRYSIVGGLVSANIRPARESTLTAPKPFVMRELSGSRIPARAEARKSFRIAIIGLSSQAPSNGLGLVIEDAFKVAREVVPAARKVSDMVVVLAFLPMRDVYKLASVVKGIDLIIGNSEGPYTPDSKRDGKAMVVFSAMQTKSLGEVRVFLDQEGEIRDYANRYVSLDHVIADDPVAAKIVADAHAAFTEAQKREAFQIANVTPAGPANFVTSQACAGCHQREYEIWVKTRHARAIGTLEKRNQQFDSSCVRCHSTGMGSGGFVSVRTTPQFAGVQCEACHSAGRLHADLPAKGFGRTNVPQVCVTCHTRENSPDFEPVSYWKRIKH